MRYDSQHKEQTRARVLKEAARAIRSEGPHRVGVASIMSRAGLTHGGFYAHFPSKDALVASAIAEMFAESLSVFGRITGNLSPEQAVAAYITFYLSAQHRDARDRGCPLPALSADLPRLTDMARTSFAVGAERLMAALAALLDAMGRPEPEALATSVTAEMLGALALARALPDKARSDAVLTGSREALFRRLGLRQPT